MTRAATSIITHLMRRSAAAAPLVLGLPLLWLAVLAQSAIAQPSTPLEQLEGVDIDPQLDAQVPLDLAFLNEKGQEVRLRELISGDKPVVLALVYYTCPRLCNLVLLGMCDGFVGLENLSGERALRVGEDFEVITISFHDGEDWSLAAEKKANHLATYDRPQWEEGWHWLSSKGYRENVQTLARTIGFYYRVDPTVDGSQTHYAHGSGIFLLTPEGRLSGAFPQHEYPAENLRYGLIEASEGHIAGSLIERAFLFCFRYDSSANSYVADARRVMAVGGILMVVVLGSFLGVMWMRETRRKTQRESKAAESAEAALSEAKE